MAENLPEISTEIKLYESFIDISINKFESLNKRFVAIDIIDLRLVGLLIFAIAIIGKIKGASSKNPREIFTPEEFIAIIAIGTLLLILGSYFSVRKIQENRKMVDEATRNFVGKLQKEKWE